MGQGSSRLRTVVVVVFAILAIALAVWSGVRSLRSPKGKAVGDLGYIGREKEMEEAPAPPPTALAPETK